MLFSNSFFTISKPAEAQVKEKGSKFIGFAFPVKNESQVKENLLELKKLHPSATHHCYAWRLGADKLAFRLNDDGEPSGTAAKPIFSQIQSNDLTNVLVVVVRYFGGTLLGVSGLIQSYKAAAAEVIKVAGIEEQFIIFEYSLKFPSEDMSAVMRLIKECEGKIISNNYDLENELVFQVKKQHIDKIEDKMKSLYKSSLKYLRTL